MEQKNLVNGPGKFELMEALFSGDFNSRKTVSFATDGGKVLHKVVINFIAREDGSGNNWMFKGVQFESNAEIKGYYNSRTRKGWIRY